MHSLGILGGTFDPVHFGHLRLALEMKERLGLDWGVHLVPAAITPLRGQAGASGPERLEMLQAAVENIDGLKVDGRELERDGPSYTIDTMESMRAEYPHSSLSFIVGMDAFAQLHRWRRWQELLDFANIAVAQRPGAKFPNNIELARFVAEHEVMEPGELSRSKAGRVCVIDVPPLAISATYVRSLIAEGRSVRFLVPESVSQLIDRNGAYCA